MSDLVSRSSLLEAYDKAHVGPPGGARKLIEEAPAVDAVPVVHGRWRKKYSQSDGYLHSYCPCCKTDAPFDYKYVADYDEDLDGEWEYIGQREDGIIEYLGNYCHNCGAKMDGE